MHEVIRSRLWIGNALDARDVRRLHDVGISAVVDLAREEPMPDLMTRDLIYCRIPIVDGSGNTSGSLCLAIETAARLINTSVSTLVACSAGMSRSPAIVAAALALVRGQSPDDALVELVAQIPHDVSPRLWGDIKDAHSSLDE